MRVKIVNRRYSKVKQRYFPANLRVLCVLIFLLFFVSTGSSQAQRFQTQEKFAFEFWHEGKMVIEGGDTLKGELQYNMQTELIQLKFNNRLETYTPRKAVFFEIFDKTVNQYRQFYSLPYALTGQYKAPVFFELLSEGKMTLMAREKVEYKTYSSFYTYGGTYTRLILSHSYFLLKEDGTIQEFKGKKNDFFELMNGKKDKVQQYAKENKLDFDSKHDIIRIVQYYNSLIK